MSPSYVGWLLFFCFVFRSFFVWPFSDTQEAQPVSFFCRFLPHHRPPLSTNFPRTVFLTHTHTPTQTKPHKKNPDDFPHRFSVSKRRRHKRFLDSFFSDLLLLILVLSRGPRAALLSSPTSSRHIMIFLVTAVPASLPPRLHCQVLCDLCWMCRSHYCYFRMPMINNVCVSVLCVCVSNKNEFLHFAVCFKSSITTLRV